MGAEDIQLLENAVQALRTSDYAAGGGSCHDAVLAQVPRAHALLSATVPARVRDRLFTAVADLHNLAGWTAFDAGRHSEARGYYQTALELAGLCGHPALEANIRYRLGRLHLHRHSATAALAEFARSQDAAGRAGSAHAAAIASANRAWSEAMRGDRREALRLLGQAEDEFVRARPGRVEPWAAFFDATDLSAMTGTVHTELAAHGFPGATRRAVPALTVAVEAYGEPMRRSRVFCETMLAFDLAVDGEFDRAAHATTDALDHAADLTSARVGDRMRPLRNRLAAQRRNPQLANLVRRLDQFIGTARS